MFDIFKKKAANPADASRNMPVNDTNTVKTDSDMIDASKPVLVLDPPKNLPELARDLYEKDAKIANTASENIAEEKSNAASKHEPQKIVAEPTNTAVPELDLDLIKNKISNITPASILEYASHAMPATTRNMQSENRMPSPSPTAPQASPLASQLRAQSAALHDSIFSTNISTIPELSSMRDDGTGFFREFEDYIQANGLDTEVVKELLGKDLLDNMIFYHTHKTDEMPFYMSMNELTHYMHDRFTELSRLEHTWAVNKQRLELMKRLNIDIENEVHLRSEELKRLLQENMKRSNTKNTGIFKDMFGIIKNTPNSQDMRNTDVNDTANTTIYSGANSASNIYTTHIIDHELSAPDRYFYMHNGQALRSITALVDALKNMSPEIYEYHVSHGRNDFANWIEGVYGLREVAGKMRQITVRQELSLFLKLLLD